MYARVLEEWVRVFAAHPPPGPDVVELGAPRESADSLLTVLHGRRPEGHYVGVNLGFEAPPSDERPYELVAANANDLSRFGDATFDAVVTNAMLEHDRAFWLTLAEVRRILRPGGYFYVGVPGYASRPSAVQRALIRAVDSRIRRVPVIGPAVKRARHSRLQATPTFMFHAAPDDYWRFSEQAVRQVFLADMECLHLRGVLQPLRFFAVGRLPA